ncbi:MAG: L-aspartate oxidase [Gordonia sp. (in: high G+C Gram-positive bacteria)]|uniref:L-aspartate oxidase n=1 Tax=Gordonia sp. (in: high G+C Gram-positive bacteria) TaxID=84139 RepID=UPI0039E36D89
MVDEIRTDVVVIGAGVAGLTAALTANEQGLDVVILNKGHAWRPQETEQSTSTFYAQGGIAVVEPDNPEDSIGLHVSDTLAAGAGLTLEEPTTAIVTDGWDSVQTLVGWGAEFDRGADGRYLRTREGGHSVRRIIHAGGDATGAHVQAALGAAAGREGLRVLDDAWATEILVGARGATGIAYTGPQGPGVIRASSVLLATGGMGHLYTATTNPSGATGDGVALALRAGAQVADLEFIQFHPTMLYVEGARGRRTLVSEAVRGEGGRLVAVDGSPVTDASVHPLGDLAPRDVVARAVTAAMKRTGAPYVYLDVSSIPDFATRFPTVAAGVQASGVELTDRLPVCPGAHYLCGGVVTDDDGRTTVPGLLAAGEVARTGLHGANRLASNSLLEGLVMGRRVVPVMFERRDLGVDDTVTATPPASLPALERGRLQDMMSDSVALQRDAAGLAAVTAELEAAPSRELVTVHDAEDAALTLAARAVVAAATARTESRGCHYRSDFPQTDPESVPQAFVLRDGVVTATD